MILNTRKMEPLYQEWAKFNTINLSKLKRGNVALEVHKDPSKSLHNINVVSLITCFGNHKTQTAPHVDLTFLSPGKWWEIRYSNKL